jgi:AcrR family transcriptional regulator
VPAKPARQRLSRDLICAAALELAAESGSADVSMRALGDRLGVDATAVYRHFADKDDLMRAVGDRALAPATKGFMTSDDPADDVRRMCTGIRKALLKNQVGLVITSAGPTRNANELRITEVMLDAFLRAGMSPDSAARAYHVLIEYTVGSAALDAPLSRSAKERKATYDTWKRDYRSLPAEEYPAIHELVGHLYPSSEDVFATGLNALITQLMPS